MYLRTRFHILCYLIVIPFFISCLGDDDPSDVVVPDDAEILSFSLSHDSVPDLVKARFSIDQKNNLIYNYDSLPYQITIPDSVIVKYATSVASSYINVQNIIDGDSIWVASGDSLDVSKPLRLRVYALDGVKTKEYDVQVNIHQVDPDSIQYVKIAEVDFLFAENSKTVKLQDRYYTFSKATDGIISLYKSDNMKDWENEVLTGLPNSAVVSGIISDGKSIYAYTKEDEGGELYRSSDAISWEKIPCEYPVISILGYLPSSKIQSRGLSIVVKKEGALFFMFIAEPGLLNDSQLGEPLSDNFPVAAFSTINFQILMVERITLIGGKSQSDKDLNTVWSTQDGLYWANLSGGDSKGAIPLIENKAIGGANAFYYNNELYLLNGMTAGGTYNSNVYFSIDGGVTWNIKEKKYFFPVNYPLRHNASVVLSNNGTFFYIIGGQNTNAYGDIWEAFINKKIFVNN